MKRGVLALAFIGALGVCTQARAALTEDDARWLEGIKRQARAHRHEPAARPVVRWQPSTPRVAPVVPAAPAASGPGRPWGLIVAAVLALCVFLPIVVVQVVWKTASFACKIAPGVVFLALALLVLAL